MREAATNKLFRAAQFVLPGPGRWEMQVEVEGLQGTAVIDGELEAAGPLPRWRETWPWIGWPVVAIALFGIHQVLVRRRVAKTGSPASRAVIALRSAQISSAFPRLCKS